MQNLVTIDLDHLLLLWIILGSGLGISCLARMWELARWHVVDKEKRRKRRLQMELRKRRGFVRAGQSKTKQTIKVVQD